MWCRSNPIKRFAVWVAAGMFAFALNAMPAFPTGLSQSQSWSSESSDASALEIGVGIQIEQITFIDQKSENFGVVATIRKVWRDDRLAAETDGEAFQVLTITDFERLAEERGALVPYFIVDNQQGQRWEQEAFVVVSANGLAEFFERSSLTLQAPYFDFTRYPFDVQDFFFEITSVLPLQYVTYRPLEGLSGLGDKLGEEAWILENATLMLGEDESIHGSQSAKISLAFTGHRHIQYYVLRIILPLALLVFVSWASFFLEDYKKRIDVGGANLLVFVAFNFAISESLPLLGYVTFLDFILQWVFIVTTAIILLNVALRRLQIAEKQELASKIDNYVVKWVFPLAYAAVVILGTYLFLL